jgi:tRNA threonylcarbamoyladenosine biosynthesis protein TsaE
MKVDISKLSSLEEFAKSLGSTLKQGQVIYLEGDLGSGKTTLVQLILKNLGYSGRVKSPTYNLYESYQFKNYNIIHMDLYRLSNPEELFYLGVEDIFNSENIVFVEWPQKGKGVLPNANKKLLLELLDHNRRTLECIEIQ